jgi:hypothetical protein
MTQRLTLQIALMVLIATAVSLILVVIGGGLAGPESVDLGQVLPLSFAGAAAFVVILANPFERSES